MISRVKDRGAAAEVGGIRLHTARGYDEMGKARGGLNELSMSLLDHGGPRRENRLDRARAAVPAVVCVAHEAPHESYVLVAVNEDPQVARVTQLLIVEDHQPLD